MKLTPRQTERAFCTPDSSGAGLGVSLGRRGADTSPGVRAASACSPTGQWPGAGVCVCASVRVHVLSPFRASASRL